ncbi:MAG TPA: folylpolyglutamate synthase/dihydrofolate synthase family protein [Candidatus Omnitrophota bacterium]|nr:folylpolyglutamate synthase/dihydrofolate synthase family protein [Candidatus Omnitrophota bacterium]
MLEFDTLNIDLGLERMQKVLSALGDPHSAFKSVHVAGTNGKGSVCAMLDSILREAGYKVGLFTSPHLFRWEERIRVNGKEINSSDFGIRISDLGRLGKEFDLKLTPFEEVTAVALQYFADEGVDMAVVEVGMGGRLDATNVITPLVSVITNIDLDHTEYLGDTVEKIAFEKAGIIKKGVPVVTAEEKPEALSVIRKTCEQNGSECMVVRADESSKAKSGLIGPHQRKNEAVAVKVAQLMNISKKAIETGLKKAHWPARFQVVGRDPRIVIDGAHNEAGAKALASALKSEGIEPPVTFVIGMQGYKDTGRVIGILAPLASDLILTHSSHPQSADPEKLAEEARAASKANVRTMGSVAEAVAEAKKTGHAIVIAGSLFVAAEALKALNIKL